ncbi:undecaprenyl/decaprenyl-phosphate alpha-N-acetylglucosaminyl 1-phosphate transferase [Candidatus Peregrinibacteria bacterium]|nr:undecaprenyl/decaprenyl-phosphate alpha-N-acetylglucosaminyl 1-phosphate transferase [Candidatus Peregrinibacteria bacterium]
MPALPFLAFAASVILHRCVLFVFPRLGLTDFPERYGIKRSRIPYPAGIAAVLLFLIFFLARSPLVLQNAGLVIGIILLAVFCFIDDRRPLPAWLRLLIQVIVSLLIFATGSRIYSFTSPLPSLTGGDVIPLDRLTFALPVAGPLPLWSGLFTIVWLGLTINALNWFDGIPGQVSVLAVIGFLTIGFLAWSARVNQPSLALIAFILAGIAAGGMLFDLPPPKLLLGDTGAMFYGLMLGVLTIYAGGKVATAFLVLGVPLIDFVIVAARRIAGGHSPLKSHGTQEHLHHRLLARGWRPEAVIVLTAGIGIAFGIAALFLSTFGKFIAAIVLFLLMSGLSFYAGLSPQAGMPAPRKK